MIRRLKLSLIACCMFSGIHADAFNSVKFHDESSDTTQITNILIDAHNRGETNPGEQIGFIAKKFLDIPYVANTLEGETEVLTINVSELDCTTFVETVMALAITVGESRTSWRDFIHTLERIRYRRGVLDGYSSRLHYISDWIIDNAHRGNFVEVTNRFPAHSYTVKSIDYMSTHRNSYSALRDSVEYEKIKRVEIGYRNHRFPYIKTTDLRKKKTLESFKEGDIVALTTKINGLDVSHLGLITLVDGVPHLMHASMKAKKVIIDPLPIHEYVAKSKSLTGLRVIRL